ncbi:MAG: Helicase associated domain protein [Lachnospiraceae bacterium]|nr:Helicase associated domain protein [Lachnospiraceae bacterium]
MSIRLYKHNDDAYRAVVSMFRDTNRAAVIHPTGTGKSFIAFKLCEDNPGKKVLWLSPSEYIVRTQVENLRESLDDTDVVSGLGCEDHKSLSLCDSILKDVRFCTYARLSYMDENEMRELTPDFIILDEFHRCGASVWGEGVRLLLEIYKDANVLGLSATAIRYLDNRRDMSDELFDGNVASSMTLGEAVVRGILPVPKYVMTLYSYRDSLRVFESRVSKIRSREKKRLGEEYLEALKRSLEKAVGLDVIFQKHMSDKCGKYIIFCSDYDALLEARDKAGEWFASVDPEPRVYTFYSEDPSSKDSFAAFKADNDKKHLKLLYCIDALNEGIHVDGISGVILMRPTVSPIVFKQQIGRALSAVKGSVPVIFDIVNNIENLYSIDSIREEMQEAIRFFREYGTSDTIVNEDFDVIDEVKDCIELFDKLEGVLSVSWDAMYKEAVAFYDRYGNLNVPYDYLTDKGWKLGRWVGVQRLNYRKNDGSISEERVRRLSLIGMDWHTPEEKSWSKAFSALKAYKDSFGNVEVPAEYKTDDGMALGRWLRNIRTKHDEGALKAYQSERLELLGVRWGSVFDSRWQACYEKALEYYSLHSDLLVPKSYETADGVKLGTWISGQRAAFRKGKLREEQIKLLDAIGMSWNRYENKWDIGYECALLYHGAGGDINSVPDEYEKDGVHLKSWLSTQRIRYHEGKLSADRQKALEKLGMNWNLHENQWDNGYRHAVSFVEEHGDLTVPTRYECMDGFKLKSWLNNQRTSYRKGKLSLHQVNRLEAIGMSWGAKKIMS